MDRGAAESSRKFWPMSDVIKYTIRKARLADMENVFLLSNDPVVRKQSIHPHPIPWEEHTTWFPRKIKDPDYFFYIVYDKQNKFIGQVRYEVQGESSIVSISISPDFRGKGLAVPLLKQTAVKFFKKKSAVRQILAYIKPENSASSHSFLKAGYTYHQHKTIDTTNFDIFIFKRPV
jgi:UDP-2,4-diacetamido-2,4,6-trideoxy-beta-L-altropyranose hydrolase